MNTTLVELGVATSVSTGVALSISAEPLLTTLITFGVSLVTLVGGELIKLLVAYLKKKREDIEGKDKEDTDNE